MERTLLWTGTSSVDTQESSWEGGIPPGGSPRVEFPDYQGPRKCTWTAEAGRGCPDKKEGNGAATGVCPVTGATRLTPSPHNSIPLDPAFTRGHLKGILNSALEAIGKTPMIRLDRFAAKFGLECELVAKCEFLSAGGSVKDRIAKRMVEEAEESGRLKQGDILIEPTSGNTGVGLSMAAAVKGYRMIITLPEKMSREKVNTMRALGAEIFRTPTEAAWDSPESHIGLALRLQQRFGKDKAHILDQYLNPDNPLAHYDGTAEEILCQCEGRLDAMVVSAGTGGTVTGLGRKMKEKVPSCRVVAVDPKGSILAQPEHLNDENRLQSYLVEGIGYDFIPTTLDRTVVDEWVKTDDQESFQMVREVIRLEGLLCGGSSGAALVAAVKVAKTMKKGQRVVVILPDSCRNYMSKFMDDDWMANQGFLEFSCLEESSSVYGQRTVADVSLRSPLTVDEENSVSWVIETMDREGVDQLPVVDKEARAKGVVTEGHLISLLEGGKITTSDAVRKGMFTKYLQVDLNCPLKTVSRMLETHPFVLVVESSAVDGEGKTPLPSHQPASKDKGSRVIGVVTRIDLLRLLNRVV